MTVPDRSELPQEFVAYLEKQNAELAEHERPKPILPAEETPEELVDAAIALEEAIDRHIACLLYTSPSPRDRQKSRMPSSA